MAGQNKAAKPRWDTGRGFIINCREQKLQFFYAGVTGVVKCIHQFPFSNRKGMAEAIELGDAQLEGAKDNRDRLSLAALEALAGYFGFDHTWTEFRNGTNEEFARRYNAENQFRPKVRRLEEQEHRSDVLLTKGPERAQVPSKIPGLASILGIVARYGRGRADFGFEVSCGAPPLIGDYRAAIKRGYVQVDCGKALLLRESRKGFGEPYEVRTGQCSWQVGWDAATLNVPRWWVEAVGCASIGDFEVPPDFATVEALSPGDLVGFSFCVWRKDYDLQASEGVPPLDNEEIAVVDKSGNEIVLNAEELSRLKQRIIAVIGKEALPDDGSGLAVLATHEIEFIASPQ